MSMTPALDHGSALRLSYARSRLAEIDRMRQVYLASLDGMSQREIAHFAHVSQPSVHRLIARARALGAERESLEEIVLRRFVEDSSPDEMIERLIHFENWVPRVIDPVDGLLDEDSQQELEELVEDGFISEEEIDRVLDARG